MFIHYYTDEHGVDEDLTSIAHYGGDYVGTNMIGIAVRYMNRSSTTTLDIVASLENKNSLSQ